MTQSDSMEQTGLTKDLNRSEEVVLVTIALNPEVAGEEMVDQLDTSTKVFSHCLDTLLQKDYIEIVREGDDEMWRVTERGQLALNKFRVNAKFDLLDAEKFADSNDDIKSRLKKKKKRFEAAFKVTRERRERKNEDDCE